VRGTSRALASLLITLLASGSWAASERFDRVVIDPGHGGEDHGAAGPAGLLEKDLVLDLAQRLARKLRAQGIAVTLTRADDAFVALDERTAAANASGADLFVSIHANASRARSARGIETFFASPEATDAAAEELARAENAAFGAGAAKLAEGDPVLAILGDLLATQQLADSQEFARIAQGELVESAAARSRGVKQAPFVVLMGVRMPAVLVEVGFITNPQDERSLRRAAERERIADGIARAIAAFRARQDERLGVASAGGSR
jgi:N-acetylmuramoyl-L-alanine amidase